MAIALAASVVIGIAGLAGIAATFGTVKSIYNDNLLAITSVVQARQSLVDTRLDLNRGLLDTTRRANAAGIQAKQSAEAAAWSVYYPAKLSSDHERMLADLYITQKKAAFDLALREARLLDDSKVDEARSMHLARTADAIGKATSAIDELVRLNETQANAAFGDAVLQHDRTRNLCLSIAWVVFIALGLTAFFLTRSVTRPLDRARQLAESIRAGHLGNKIVIDSDDELSDTLRALGDMDAQLSSTVGAIRDIAEQVSGASSDLSQGNLDLSQRTQEQASALEETAASMEELSTTVHQNAESAVRARALARRVLDSATEGQRVSADAAQAMNEVSAASERINDMNSLIDEVSFQTNLLALNAAVEAARAGEQGRGFAVVAGEVRALAQRSAAAAKDIKALIADTLEKVGNGASLVVQTNRALSAIGDDARAVNEVIAGIALASTEQSAGISQVNDAVMALDDVTQQNAALVEEATAAAKSTSDLAADLLRQVSFFEQFAESEANAQAPAPRPRAQERLNAPFASGA
jgi:methyl-accepting chemotaxis protein